MNGIHGVRGPGLSYAVPGGAGSRETFFNSKDMDQNGALSRGELGVPEDVFQYMDRNKDGGVDKKELNSYFSVRRLDEAVTGLIGRKDENGDRVLSVEELGVSDEAYQVIDKDKNNEIDRAELNRFLPEYTLANRAKRLIDAKDSNGNQVLSMEEMGVPGKVFENIDTDGDGQASIDEIAHWHPVHNLNEKSIHIITSRDLNGDNLLGEGEVANQEILQNVDLNCDDHIERVELNLALYRSLSSASSLRDGGVSRMDIKV